jgi:hypothetical protein
MSSIFSPSPSSVGLSQSSTTGTSAQGHAKPKRRFDSARGLAAMLLAAMVSALVVLADRLASGWADGHLFLGWVMLWVVVFASSALFAGSARRLARSTLRSLDSWSRSMAEARAEARLWDLARTDPRLKSELMLARARAVEEAEAAAVPAVASNDFSNALAPMGLDSGFTRKAGAGWRRLDEMERRLKAGYLPYL